MKYGIGITTRNRPLVLDAALKHFAAFPAEDSRIVVVDDCSDVAPDEVIENHSTLDIDYRVSPRRLGIAGAKNACLAKLTDCDHVFLFDDDAWPIAHGWADQWTAATEAHRVGHTMWIVPVAPGRNPAVRSRIDPVRVIGSGKTELMSWNNSLGVMLHFTRKCLDILGGFDAGNARTVYGYEHVQMSARACRAGFTRGEHYLAPSKAGELVFSVDISHGCYGMKPPLEVGNLNDIGVSLSPAERSSTALNSSLLKSLSSHRKLVDPL